MDEATQNMAEGNNSQEGTRENKIKYVRPMTAEEKHLISHFPFRSHHPIPLKTRHGMVPHNLQ